MKLEGCEAMLGDLIVRSTVLGFVIWVSLQVFQRRQANFRCGLLTVGMFGLLLLPLTWCLPRVEVPFLPTFLSLIHI